MEIRIKRDSKKMLVMETKFYIKNRENRMETIFKKVTKWVALFLCVLLGSSGAFAQTQTLLVDGASSASVCPGDPIVLTTSKFPEGSVAADILISTDGGSTWKASGTSSDPSRVYTFVMDMGSSAVMFKVRTQGLATPVETNTVSVQVETECAKECHQSSSGEYINGTDFTPKSPNYSNSHSLGQLTNSTLDQIENYFPEQKITLETSGCTGEVSNDFGDFFGNLKPKNDEGNFSNYYWFTSPNSEVGNCTPFHYKFLLLDDKKNQVWDDKYYRMTLKSYIRLKCSSNCSYASVKLECSQGSHGNFYQNADHADIFIIDDQSGDTLGIKSINKSFDQINVGDLFCKSEYQNKLLRMEIHFYGRFDAMNKNANTVFEMKPLFQQFGCVQMAIDYISADIMSICMDNGAACIGENVTVNAAGFPYGADYVWEVENENGGWDKLIVNGYDVSKLNYQTVNVPVEKLGKRRYRVGDAKTIATGESDYLYFNVTGKDCEPVQPKDISVSDLCAPVSNYEFAVSPIDANPNVRYSWTLIDADGKDITSTNLKFTAAGATTGRGDKVYVSLNSENARGKYYVKVQPITVRNSSDGSTYEEPAGTPILDSFIVYQSPVVSLSLNGFGPDVSESEKKLCPNDDEQGITAVVDPKYNFYDYVYTWENATAQVAGGNVADVILPKEQACAGTLLSHTIKATVEIKDVGCPTVVTGTYKVDKLVDPTIDCSMLNDKIFTLGATDKFYVLELPKPDFSAGCDSNPDIKITVVTMPNDASIASSTTEFTIAKNKWETADKTVKLPAGTASVTYRVIDACDKEASCTATITIEDVTPPNLDCDIISDYTTTTTVQGSCEANPGLKVELPKLEYPVLSDRNNVDGDITGEYWGRLENPATEPNPDSEESRAQFSKLNDLNDPYVVGTTYILWGFTDASGNTAYCTQKVVLVDDLSPKVTCPTVPVGFTVASFPDICGLSVNGLLKQVEAPVAYDVCSGEGVRLEPKVYISEFKNNAWTEYTYIDTANYNDIIFDVNHEYRIVWRYFKAQNSSVYEDCMIEFGVKDMSAPKFDCTTLSTVYVLANNYKELNKLPLYLTYASYADVKHTDGNTYDGSLKDPFDNGTIHFVTPDEVTDNCDNGNITVKVELFDPAGNLVASSDDNTLNSLEDLKEQKFNVGMNEIRYTFSDLSGNQSVCSQNIVVSTGTTPEPDCPAEYITLRVDKNCETEFILKKEDVPTANVPVLSRGLYFVFQSNVISNEVDLYKYFPSNDGVHPDNIGKLSDKSPYWLDPESTHPAPENKYTQFGKLSMNLLCQVTSFEYFDQYNNGNAYEKAAVGPGMGGPGWPFGPGMGGPGASQFTPIGKLINWNAWKNGASEDKMIGVSNSMSMSDQYTIYPYKIELLNADGTPVMADATIAKDDEYGTDDGTFVAGDDETVRYRYFRPRAYYPWNLNGDSKVAGYVGTDEYDYVCEAKSLNRVNDYEEEIVKLKLRKGEYQLIYHFENQRNENADDYETVACTVKVVVEDTIPPTMDCNVIDATVTKKTFAANANCEVYMDSLVKYGFKEFSKEELLIADNCSDTSNIKLMIERVHNGLINKEHTSFYNLPLEMGLTTFRWIIEDESANRDTCELNITVVDESAPVVDCSKIPVITAYTTPMACEASADAVVEAGLSTPEVDNDACSPVGTSNKIKAEGVRSDGNDIFADSYPLGQTTITWTFTDGAGNSVSCEQIINVIDTITPIFGECDDMEDLVYELPSKDCDAKKDDVLLLLGSHQAKDVCDPNPIMGVPYVDNNGTLEELPELFKRNKTYTIAWVFQDKAGNRTICYQSLEIKDVTAPIVDGVCPEPTKSVNATTECSVNFSDLQLPTPTFEDPCDGVLIPQLVGKITQNDGRVNVYYDGELETITYPVGTHTFLWIYSDAAGNKDTCSMELTVEDMIKPILEDCEVSPSVTVTVSDNFCEITPAELEKLIVHPKAYDECDDLKGDGGKNYIDPVIERWYDANEDGAFDITELVVDADGLPIVWNSINFPKGTTMIRWIFADKAGNQVSCDKLVIVEDHTPPFFDCATIDPDTLRPVAPEGCDYEFADLKRDILDKLSYKAYDACTKDSIPGILTTDGVNPIPDSYTLESGVMYKLIWVFADEDGNKTTCDQWILPSHNMPLNVDCDALSDTIKVIADEGTCEAIQDSVLKYVEAPTAKDPCNNDLVVAVPHFKVDDEFVLIDLATQKFVTGNNTIHWQFVSPWNLSDTAWCEQNIIVKGNKKFDIDCDVVAPTYHDTILDCGPADPANLSIKTPWVADPCLTESDTAYKRMGVGVRSDSLAMTDPFPLGNTQIKWTFTDFTGGVDTFCIQDIELRTEEEMIVNCDAIEDVKVDVAEGECTVPSDKVQLPTPQYALHPCLKDESGNPLKIEGVPSRGDKKELDEPYYVGRTLIIWTFTDTTNTLAKPVDTCHSYVQVGDVNEMPVECENFPDTLIVLPDDKCELSWADVNFEVKPVVDLCTREIIDPVVYVTGLSEVIEYLDYKTYFVLQNGDEVDELEPTQVAVDTVVKLLNDLTFKLGASTITWEYNFKGTVFSCIQTISIKNKVAPSGGCESVPDELTIVAPSGECEIPTDALVDSLLNMLQPWPVAYDHCDVDKANPIKGKIYFEGKEITSDGSFSLPVGENKVQWVFIDTAINTVGDTCDKTLIIQSDMAPIFNCLSLDTLNFETDKCEYTYEWNDENIPQAKDTCTGEFFAGVGTRSDNADLNAPYPMGKTIITWTFKSPYSTDSTICEQVVWVRTTAQPLFDCETLDTIKLSTPEGICEADAFAYLEEMNKPVAEDSCTQIKIIGVPLTKDSVAYSTTDKFVVGDTTKIIWKFFHDSLNVTPKYCDQYVLVTGSNEPIFDCEALQEQDIKFEIAGCDTILGSDAIPTPAAIDYCTKDSVYGVGSRSDGKALDEPFPVGTTTITWLFKSPYSEISADCDQKVVVLSTQEIDFNCEDLDSIYVPIGDVNTCDTSGLILNTPVALHPCPEQSGVAEIKGVPFINKAVTITPNADSTEWTIDKIHVGLHKITWTFTDPSDPATLVVPVKECEQVLQIGDGTNASVDCENYPDTTIVLDPADCAISWEDMNLNIKPVYDVCSGELLVPTLSRSSGKAIEASMNPDSTLKIVAEDFTVGVDTIIWFFESIGAQCEQAILVKDNIAPEFDCDNFEPNHLTLTAPSGECEVIASAIYDSLVNLFEPWPFAIEKCTRDTIPGRVYLDEIATGNELLKGSSKNITVGDHKLVWLFIDSLINQVGAVCEKDFTLKSDMAPMFDCESLTDLKFDIEGCNTNSLTTDDIPTPQAKDACVDTLISGVGVRLNPDSTIQMDGTEPLPVLGVYPVGTTIIRWTFTSPFSNEEKVCYQNVVVKTTQEIDFDCESLEGEVIRISVNPLTLVSDPEAESSKIDTLHAIHPCPAESGVEFILGVPSIEGQEAFILSSDSTKWTIPALPADTYKVVWTFADTTETMVDPIKRCEQTLIVENLKDTLFCPPGRNQSTITCVTEESLPIFNSFEEFKAAGGWITDHNQFDASSFGYIEDSIGTPYCDQTRYVTYFVLDVRGDKISCTDTIFVKDNEAPIFAEMVDTFTIACDEELPIFEKAQVDDCDPDVKLNLDSVSHQGDNPSECNYYSYTIDYQWTAVDRCNNKSVYPFVLSVVDTIAPTINLPLDWSDTALSNYLKGCIFSVPDFEEDLRSEEVIQDNCSSLDNIKISQYPAAGDTIKKTTTIYITISDPCGKDTVVTKVVYVQERDEILSLDAYDITKCGSDSSVIDLWGQTTRFATGFRYLEYGGTWYPVPSNPVYDCYRDSISEESLVFSDNPLTYYDKFHPGPSDTDKEIQRSLTELKRMSRSGKYIFVAVDTATMCRDTASSYLTINERPRVAIESGIMTICELTTVDSLDLYSYVKCVDDMGSEITNEGWTLGEDVYSFVDSVIMANNEDNLIYFVENACGKTTSEDTYITFCDSIPTTTEDSLKWVGGSDKNLAMLRSEDYKTKDSVLLDVRKRFESEAIAINSTPDDPARIWKGEQVVLELNTDYKFDECLWYKVRGYFDYSPEVIKDSLNDEMDELLDIMEYSDLYELFENPEDTSVYYVTLTDGVCPAIPGQLLQVDVLPKLPTAFTPYDKDGMNDVYMEGRAVVIFDRYGAKVFEGDNGWDGTFKGRLADPGVYYSKVFLNSGMSLSGTIEIVKVK